MGNILAGTYSDRRVDWTTSKLSQKKKEQNRAKRILSNAQKKMGVKLLMVSDEGKCYFYKHD